MLKTILLFDCRGVEPADFSPRSGRIVVEVRGAALRETSRAGGSSQGHTQGGVSSPAAHIRGGSTSCSGRRQYHVPQPDRGRQIRRVCKRRRSCCVTCHK